MFDQAFLFRYKRSMALRGRLDNVATISCGLTTWPIRYFAGQSLQRTLRSFKLHLRRTATACKNLKGAFTTI
jgi:hypothetical protein